MQNRKPVHVYEADDLINWLADELPPIAEEVLVPGLKGDRKAALQLYGRAPNGWRGWIALAAYYYGTPNPAYRELLRSVWNHDHTHLLHAVGGKRDLVRRMMKEGDFEHPHSGQIRIFRGYSGNAITRATRGLSWTTSRETACWFARRSATATRKPLVLTAAVDSSDIIFYDNERNEEEVVLRRAIVGSPDPDPATWTTT